MLKKEKISDMAGPAKIIKKTSARRAVKNVKKETKKEDIKQVLKPQNLIKDENKEQIKEKDKYIYGTGGRKEATVQLRLFPDGQGKFLVNDKDYMKYFPYFEFQKIVTMPLEQLGLKNKFDIIVKVKGGGTRGQAEAIRYALSHSLVKFNTNFRKSLKKLKFLTRDSRIKERKKPGLKKARRAPQWQKR